jgi:hypothetical protein
LCLSWLNPADPEKPVQVGHQLLVFHVAVIDHFARLQLHQADTGGNEVEDGRDHDQRILARDLAEVLDDEARAFRHPSPLDQIEEQYQSVPVIWTAIAQGDEPGQRQ